MNSLASYTEDLSRQSIHLLESRPVRGAGLFLCNFLPLIYTKGINVKFVEAIDPDQAGESEWT